MAHNEAKHIVPSLRAHVRPRWFESLSPRDLNHVLSLIDMGMDSTRPFTMAYYPTSGALRLPAAQVHRQIIDLDLLPSDIDQSFCHDNDPLFVAVGPDAAAQEWRAAFGRQADLYILLDEDHYANGGSSVPEREQRATE
jgi:hypothetical protein